MWVGRSLASLLSAWPRKESLPFARLYASRTSGSRFSSHLASTPSTPPSPMTPSPFDRSSGPPSSVSLKSAFSVPQSLLNALSPSHVQYRNQKDDQSQQHSQDDDNDGNKDEQNSRKALSIVTRPRHRRHLWCGNGVLPLVLFLRHDERRFRHRSFRLTVSQWR